MTAPTGALETPSGYPIIDPDTINPQVDWPNIEQAQADWLDTHTILRFASKAALEIARPTMPPGQSGFAYIVDKGWLMKWTGSAWAPAHSVSGFGAVTFTSGVGTLTHNLGFVPAIITIGARLDTAPVFVTWSLGVGTTTATTCQVRAWNVASGTAYTGSLSVVTFVASA